MKKIVLKKDEVTLLNNNLNSKFNELNLEQIDSIFIYTNCSSLELISNVIHNLNSILIDVKKLGNEKNLYTEDSIKTLEFSDNVD